MASPGGPVVQGELRVCPECGAIAPTERSRCPVCDTALGPLCPAVPCPLPARAWARGEFTLPCAACATVIPLRPDSVGAPVACNHCGHVTEVDTGWWDEALHMAHAAVDLSLPDFQGMNAPLGAYNPFAQVGSREAFAELPGTAIPSQSPLRLRVGPGAPLCPRCRNPVTVRFNAPGRLTAQCARCGDREAFSVPDVMMQRFPAMRALIAYAPENAAAAGRVEPWWMLIEGLSYMRPMVQEQKSQAERAMAEQNAWQTWQQQERDRQEREAQERGVREAQEHADRERREREAQERADRERQEREGREAREDAEREKAGREIAERELAELRTFHAAEMDRLQRDAWQRSENERMLREQQSAGERERAAHVAHEHTVALKKSRTRWIVAMVLWAMFFVAVLGDLAIYITKP